MMNAVEAYITDYPDLRIQELMHEAHQFLLQSVPQIQASIKWKLPCYSYCKRNLCYIKPNPTNIYIGWMYGHLLPSQYYPVLKQEGRKQIRVTYFESIEDIYNPTIAAILHDALHINESF